MRKCWKEGIQRIVTTYNSVAVWSTSHFKNEFISIRVQRKHQNVTTILSRRQRQQQRWRCCANDFEWTSNEHKEKNLLFICRLLSWRSLRWPNFFAAAQSAPSLNCVHFVSIVCVWCAHALLALALATTAVISLVLLVFDVHYSQNAPSVGIRMTGRWFYSNFYGATTSTRADGVC